MANVNGVQTAKDVYYNQDIAGRQSSYIRFQNPESPIPAQIEDGEEYARFFKTFREVFVPYAGTNNHTSHSLLHFLLSLSELSPTQAGVIRAKKFFAFGGKVKVARRDDPVFDIGEIGEVSASEQQSFLDFLKLIQIYDASDNLISVRDLAEFWLQDDEGCGNLYFEIVKAQVGNEKVFRVYTHSPTHCLYLATNKYEPRYIAISPYWTIDYLNRKGFDVLPVYPNWSDNEDGVMRTIVHIKSGNYTWYGRPISIASMLDQFFEFQNADYKTKAVANHFMAQALIEFEDGEGSMIDDEAPKNAGFPSFARQMELNFTNESKRPQRVMAVTRPPGAKEAFVHEFKPQTSETWSRTTGEDAEKSILKTHAFPRRFIGIDSTTGFSTAVFLDEFETLLSPLITKIQQEVADIFNTYIVKEAAEFFGMPQMADLGVQFTTPFEQMIQQRKDAANNADDSLGGSEIQPGE